ncbi:monooxygenase 1 isoform X2 [Vigna radiata var. radiata]|uniref:Monooxygenase 1 isoform X2 n=1 Tax=Vigna radiata var. radiata TaxID=3916 RepID=A0A3Q0ELR8_VIGRR|nr:monooxygenase 1 isoform X2 [Vigna radiata var. radiata]
MDTDVDAEIVIVGAGICGLATALALHRKRIKSVVLERSETVRATGAAIIVQANGWRALDELGIGSTLRETAIQIHSVNKEFRCLKRTDLVKVMADNLPTGTIRTNCQVLSVELDPVTKFPHLMLSNGSVLRAKVVIGCDGVNSAIASMFGLHRTTLRLFSTSVARGFTNYPNGHKFSSEFVMMSKGQVQLGRLPVTDKLVYWFVTRLRTSKDSKIWKDPVLIRQSLMESMKGFPAEAMEMMRNSKLSFLHLTELKYRPPWDLLFNNFRKGTVTIAGDAMHPTGPFVAQGGSASIEDAIVLARCLAQKMFDDKNKTEETTINSAMAEEAFDQYVKERKMRNFWLSFHSFLVGKKLDTTSSIIRFIILAIMSTLFRDPDWHSRYHCGNL